MKTIMPLLLPLSLLIISGCGANSEDLIENMKVDTGAFQSYWYTGKAEITRYKLLQARYGRRHEGDAVHIFVTEPFLAGKQVKQDYEGEGKAYPVLKLNATKNFLTGIYPYSLMTSVFSEVKFNDRHVPKVSFSSQEWCGNMYAQMNLRDNQYQVDSHSYFQDEADREYTLENVWLEDEIWSRIRMAPNQLPINKIRMIPSLEHTRLFHNDLTPMDVAASLREEKDRRFSKKELFVYELAYTQTKRKLTIYFEKKAPYAILGWRETSVSGRDDDRPLETIAIRTHSTLTDYWNHNQPENRGMREELGLTQ